MRVDMANRNMLYLLYYENTIQSAQSEFFDACFEKSKSWLVGISFFFSLSRHSNY